MGQGHALFQAEIYVTNQVSDECAAILSSLDESIACNYVAANKIDNWVLRTTSYNQMFRNSRKQKQKRKKGSKSDVL